ncbi:MAG: hypothetical protein IT285_05890 [Bdellovibrionales bacterium]|nr:hypothetical protein [Bdellovibrionales bacterium]
MTKPALNRRSLNLYTVLAALAAAQLSPSAWAGDGTSIRNVIGTGEGSKAICSTGAFVWCNQGSAQSDAEEEARTAARQDAEDKCRDRDDFLALVSVADTDSPIMCGVYQPWGQPARVKCRARALARCEVRVPQVHVSGSDGGSSHAPSWTEGGLLGGGSGGAY